MQNVCLVTMQSFNEESLDARTWKRSLLHQLFMDIVFFKTYMYLRWPNTVLARALADAIQCVHKDCKNKHVVDTVIILFAQCLLYFAIFLCN